MKRLQTYRLWLFCALLALAGCSGSGSKKLNQRVTLWRGDEIPYGTKVAYEGLKYLFPDADIAINKLSPDRYKAFQLGDPSTYNIAAENEGAHTAWVIIAPAVVPDKSEVNALLGYAGSGHNIFISSFRVGSILLDSLRLRLALPEGMYRFRDSLQLDIYRPVTGDSIRYAYPGLAGDNFIAGMDTSVTAILGHDARGRADFVRLSYKGGGNIFLHLAPTAFTNFFLLHKDNRRYYENAFSYLPATTDKILWDDYFRYNEKGNRNSFSALGFLLRYESFRWALALVLLLFMVLFLFGSKRRQRIIPVAAPLQNSSVDFVKTVGRLYYQRKDNKNLARKLATYFLEQVRTKYGISTARLDEAFASRLSLKSGGDAEVISAIVYFIKTLPDYPAISDEELMHFNKQLEAFYKYQ